MDPQTYPGESGPEAAAAPEPGEEPAVVVLAAAVPAAEAALDRAALVLLGAARGRALPWPRIGAALNLSPDGARDRLDRAAARHPDYTPPLPLTLSAHRARAAELLNALDGVGPGEADLAAQRLGALLLAAALIGAEEAAVAGWLAEDTLAGAVAATPSTAPGCAPTWSR